MDINNRYIIWQFYFIFTLMTFIGQVAHAVEHTQNTLELSAIANLDKAALKNDHWHTVLPVLGDENQYFIATKSGKIYQLNNSDIAQSAFLDLRSALKNSDIIALTAITLDPNFNYRERDGYQTFYTAHTEASKKTKQKLAPKNPKSSVPYDAVIMRWQLTYLPNQAPKIIQQREVMRIAIQRVKEHIQQLSFNPYIEPWHDDFGLLFIALNQSEGLKDEALYAGTILRVAPKKNGLQSYTIPNSNPFVKTVKIHDEIIFIAGQEIESFDWEKQSSYRLLVQLNYQNTHVLAQAKFGDDWRGALPLAQIKKRLPPANTKRKALLYQGRELKNLWGKALYLEEDKSNWQLQASALSSTDNNDDKNQNTLLNIINHNANRQTKFSLHQSHDGELLLLEHSQQHLYTIKAPETVIATPAFTGSTINTSNTNSAFALIFFIAFMLISYFWYRRMASTKKQHFLYQQWANFDIDSTSESLFLYKRHVRAVEKKIKISSLISSKLLLNNEIISIVCVDSAQAFSNDLEDQVLTIFSKEHRLKMINEQQRKIQLCLTDEKNTPYLFCLYFRVGNIRHTKLQYQQVINKVIDWQWLFAQHINPDLSLVRKVKISLKPEQKIANVQTSNEQVDPEVLDDNSTEINATEESTEVIYSYDTTSLQNNVQSNNEYSANIDTKLVSALDKLVLMKKQGYLDESEFNIAKAKILKDLSNEKH